jgi:predicted outer membrane repeat protein
MRRASPVTITVTVPGDTCTYCTRYFALQHYIHCVYNCNAGGALYTEVNVAVEVAGCSLDSNTAVRIAGALFLSDGGTITASNFTRNSATSGGAIYSQVSTTNAKHSTT